MNWIRFTIGLLLLTPLMALASAASTQHTGINFWWGLAVGAAICVFFSFAGAALDVDGQPAQDSLCTSR
jgi:hypothetical protein